MTRIALLATAAFAFSLAGCQQAEDASSTAASDVGTEPRLLGSAILLLSDGALAGSAELLGSESKASMNFVLKGLPEGVHAVHLHSTGNCLAPDFTSAGGHLNPEGKEHGTENPNGSHLGDLPNVEIGPDGTGRLEATLSGSLEDALDAIFDEDGSAIVVHAGADDNMTDPSGNAGSRIACGVLGRS